MNKTHYIFKLTYSNGDTFVKQFNAFDALTAWGNFNKWVEGFVYGKDNSVLINVSMCIE